MNKFARTLVASLDEQIKTSSDSVASGAATDYADYRGRCGEIKALKRLRSWIVEKAKTEDESDD